MKLIVFICVSCLLVAFVSCNEKEILEETPLDFLTAENSYVTPEGINSALVQLYARAAEYSNVNASDASDGQFWFGTDVCYHARYYNSHQWTVYDIKADDQLARNDWRNAYKIIFGANVILGRASTDAENPIAYNDESLRKEHLGEAAFFRAWAYRALVHLFGDVPLVLDEVTEAKRDYVRTPKAEVLAQIIKDFNFAKDNLPRIDNLRNTGRIPKAAAYHYLAETYIANGQNSEAITATSWIIDGGDYALMTDRFGSRKDEPGDVFWDLFRLNNQNRTSGNTETIWAYQDEYPTQGGDLNARWERVLGGEYNRWRAKNEYEGVRTFIYESTYKGGRAQGFIRPTSHVTHGIWEGNFDNDIRNSEYNIERKWWVDNPQSLYYGDTIDLSDPTYVSKYMYGPAGIEDDTNRYVYPYYLKFVRTNNHEPEELTDGSLTAAQKALATPEHIALIESYGGVGPKLHGDARRYRADIYALRLTETYLLRAEAYLNEGNKTAAAADINIVRSRANAKPALPGDVDIDYILDERLRELIFEEPRRITLGRLGLIYDRTSR
ncbi:MAG: RagB/SusD family nutrient uptake outer membrane protein, partial [Cyclobacteriaceae bacterium]|nr:RagB/SusD family nutrient uptake outer membrane protein [Cyclobacteriaceae bacterium]